MQPNIILTEIYSDMDNIHTNSRRNPLAFQTYGLEWINVLEDKIAKSEFVLVDYQDRLVIVNEIISELRAEHQVRENRSQLTGTVPVYTTTTIPY